MSVYINEREIVKIRLGQQKPNVLHCMRSESGQDASLRRTLSCQSILKIMSRDGNILAAVGISFIFFHNIINTMFTGK